MKYIFKKFIKEKQTKYSCNKCGLTKGYWLFRKNNHSTCELCLWKISQEPANVEKRKAAYKKWYEKVKQQTKLYKDSQILNKMDW